MEAAAQSSFFALGAAAAAATGGGLRTLETRRIRAVHEARRSQRLQLAGNLHDFVAHDVSGIVVLAQAAQVIGADRPEEVLPLLRQIEASGLQALGSMDRTVHMLRSSDGTAPAGREATDASPPVAYGLEDIVDAVDRFRTAGLAEVRLDMDRSPERIGRIPREVASTAHRVVVEALTNIRRHAGTAPWVTVSVTPGPERPQPVLTVSVANGPPTGGETAGGHLGDRERPGASGLRGLAERARALGGPWSSVCTGNTAGASPRSCPWTEHMASPHRSISDRLSHGHSACTPRAAGSSRRAWRPPGRFPTPARSSPEPWLPSRPSDCRTLPGSAAGCT